jgi:hypothetical protein
VARDFLRGPYWPLRAARVLGYPVPWPVQYLRAAPFGTKRRIPVEYLLRRSGKMLFRISGCAHCTRIVDNGHAQFKLVSIQIRAGLGQCAALLTPSPDPPVG